MKKIAVASGKGGTGKTLLASNLAMYLSKKHQVLLTDLDVEEPNSGFFVFGTESQKVDAYKYIPEWNSEQCILCGQCTENCNFHAVIQLGENIVVFNELCHSCYACSELCPTGSLPMVRHKIGEIRKLVNVHQEFVEGKLRIGEEQAVPLIHQTQKFAIEHAMNAEIEIIDCPPGNSCPVTAAVRDADFVILVTEPTPFGLNDLKIAVELMNILQKRIGVVINRDGIGDARVHDYCLKSGIPVLGKIQYDRRIAESYAMGELVFMKIGHVNQAIIDIYDHLMEELADE